MVLNKYLLSIIGIILNITPSPPSLPPSLLSSIDLMLLWCTDIKYDPKQSNEWRHRHHPHFFFLIIFYYLYFKIIDLLIHFVFCNNHLFHLCPYVCMNRHIQFIIDERGRTPIQQTNPSTKIATCPGPLQFSYGFGSSTVGRHIQSSPRVER